MPKLVNTSAIDAIHYLLEKLEPNTIARACEENEAHLHQVMAIRAHAIRIKSKRNKPH